MRFLPLLLVLACGPIPAHLDYTESGIVAATVGAPITPLVPRVDNSVRAYAVQPALPAGLLINAKTGVISGTPTVAQSSKRYEVVASNQWGVDSTTLSITVLGVLPASFAYTTPEIVATSGSTIAQDVPQLVGGPVAGANFSIAPALPLGLSLDPASGVISGTAPAPVARTTFVVTATLGSTMATAPVAVTVN